MSSMVVFQLFCPECDLVYCMDTRDEFCHAVESAVFVRASAISSHMRCMINVLCESCQSTIERIGHCPNLLGSRTIPRASPTPDFAP